MSKKLLSRKLWLAVAGMALGVFLALGGDSGDAETLVGSVTALVSAASYIFSEGMVDAAALSGRAKTVAEPRSEDTE